FDSAWFDELRGLSDEMLQDTRAHGIEGYCPHVGEVHRAGHISGRFLNETESFVRIMDRTRYKFGQLFRAYARHVVDFPSGRAFRQQWNIAFTAGDSPDDDYVRIGIGFRLSEHERSNGVVEYLEFVEQARRHRIAFDRTFQDLGNFYQMY